MAVCSDKGSPGVTSTALGLAATSPAGRSAVVEADTAGGDLQYRLWRPDQERMTRTVVGLASAASGGPDDPDLVQRLAYPITDQLAAVPGHQSVEEEGGLAQDWGALARALSASDVDVFADLGRLDGKSPGLAVVYAADAVVVVSRAHAEAVRRLRARLRFFRTARVEHHLAAMVWVVLVGERSAAKAASAEVRALLDQERQLYDGLSWIGWDPRGLEAVEQGHDPRRSRNLFARSAAKASKAIVGNLIASGRAPAQGAGLSG